jgi:hypothetical protein
MCQALALAKQCLEVFIRQFPACYPPLVCNITDGAATDGDPLQGAQALRQLTTDDGNVLLFNAHISANQAPSIGFPSSEDGLPDKFASLLFRMSSCLPPRLIEAARGEGFTVTSESRGFVFNGDLVAVIRFLDIGTRVALTLR